MARLTISEAIRQSGISRSTFYEKYIRPGKISVSESHGKKFIDSSEVLRVFGELKGHTEKDIREQTESNEVGQKDITLAVQAEQIKQLTERLAEAKEREQQYIDRETFHREQIKLLEAPKKKSNPFTRWWHNLDNDK